MRIALFGTPCSEQFTKYIQHLVSRLESENVSLLVYEDYLSFLEKRVTFLKNASQYLKKIIFFGRKCE